LLAYSDAGDVVFDPSWAAERRWPAALLDRTGYGCEISPAYCDVIVRRIMNLTGETPILAATGETFAAVAESRGVPADEALNRSKAMRGASSTTDPIRTTDRKESPGMKAKSRTTNREVASIGGHLRAFATSPYRFGPSTS